MTCRAREGWPGVAAAVAVAAGATVVAAQFQPRWWDTAVELEAGRYRVRTDLGPREARRITGHLADLQGEYARRLAGIPPRAPSPLVVLLFARREDYLETIQQRFGVDPQGTGGLFVAGPTHSALALYVEDQPPRRFMRALQHEGFHQFAYSRFGGDLPIWVNEGLAEYFGEAFLDDGRLIVGLSRPQVLAAVQQALELGTYVPFERMLSMTSRQWSEGLAADAAPLRYHQAWSMVQFLVYGDGGRYAAPFEKYLRMINAGFTSSHAFSRAFETDDIASFEARWKEFVLAAAPSALGTALERIEFLAMGAIELGRQGSSPESLGELAEALRGIGFSADVSGEGANAALRAGDESVYRIPLDGLCQEQPVFDVVAARTGHLPRRLQRLEEVFPTPPSIRTVNLRPCDLEVRWSRDPQTGAFRYEIRRR
jgi:hypothetical protein